MTGTTAFIISKNNVVYPTNLFPAALEMPKHTETPSQT